MEQTELERFKSILERMLAELKKPLHSREDISIEYSPDALEQLQSARDRELAIRRLEADSGRIRDVMDALQRIKERTYGFCTHCESEISVKRLNAVPWTEYCLECQRIADQREARSGEVMPARFAGSS
jgi:DnaK suppressor protein